MGKGIFITGTGTDVGKTYVAALLMKRMKELGFRVGYYKAAMSGANTIAQSDAGYVNVVAKIEQDLEKMVSYCYKTPVSPHLAAKLEGNAAELSKIKSDFLKVCERYDYVVVEGSGGVVCPIRYDETEHIFLEDIIKAFEIGTLIVADAGLGTINALVLTAEYLRQRKIGIQGIVLNRFTGSIMERDNCYMIEELTGLPVLALIRPEDQELNLAEETLRMMFEEGKNEPR